jgi:hypothetical protein
MVQLCPNAESELWFSMSKCEKCGIRVLVQLCPNAESVMVQLRPDAESELWFRYVQM